MSGQTYFTRAEAADEVRVKVDTIRRAINSGRLRAKKSGDGGGGKTLIHRDDLKAWFDGLVDA